MAVVQLLACIIKHSCADVGVILGRGVGLAMTAKWRDELELLHCVVFVVGVEAMMGWRWGGMDGISVLAGTEIVTRVHRVSS